MTTFFIVRHGNTFAEGDTPLRIGRRTDLPLTEGGRGQADALGRWFAQREIAFSHALYGPLRRTSETARLILAEQRAEVPAVPAAMLAEIDHGIDEGQPDSVVVARIGAAALRRWDEEGIPPQGWLVERDARIAWWQSIFRDPPGEAVLVVTSNGAARFALLALEPPLSGGRSLKLRTGAFGRLGGTEPGNLHLVEWDVRPPSDDGR